MEEVRRVVPFECRRCWHVWEEEYLVRYGEDRHGNDRIVWLQDGVAVPPPTEGMICPRCHCQQATTFPDGYLRRHPELIPSQEPAKPDDKPLLSPVPKRLRFL
ncbi:hypothetical protein GCM10010149_71320 [Nonomuraea roseoviolacea subsp. roseoviolacea]|uniref:Uncharacterized protein n=1 Tax=Nonomuraea roseoviolacea subsp. carminata TaxID=160689 RepID=A0ABT1KAS9_9ACTN|nr:hypothetical protein [Nonomuraea roseoviolacea]MCP2350059.1 hypothetical protein [Nonomuraea roseoviolacea subsp. carminata]